MARILLIEDNPANRRLVTLFLRNTGHTLRWAEDAETGIALAREILPDLILMDIQLPDMDGLSATRLLKADVKTQVIPILALTAFAMKGDEARMRAAGCDGYLAKPIRHTLFIETVQRFLLPQEVSAHDGKPKSPDLGGR